MSFALVSEGVVLQISPEKFWVASGFIWIDVSAVTPAPDVRWTAQEADGVWSFTPPVIPVLPLRARAATALQSAQDYVRNNYTMLNSSTPDAWVVYLKALMQIASGSDTTSTVLPTAPSTS
ncbi:hypothetical protein NKW45_05605 [Acetobacter orientalis]|uniref:hypothetical protein n=1 Tax=Acetobacter orientalis TaxID=146474 RepID=UPI0020A49DD6|nr:hypothetical protein [Acetobacter orientalis]MCP1221321.1 hypothetical protein [Acetobacter orientalis]